MNAEIGIPIKKFIIWLVQKQEWYYDSTINLWSKNGYANKTTDELFNWYLKEQERIQLTIIP
jgi:hypothetical protein